MNQDPATHLPVQLAVVDHGIHAEGLDGVHAALLQRPAANLHHVDGVVVALCVQKCGSDGVKVSECGLVERHPAPECGNRLRTTCWGCMSMSDFNSI